MPGGLAGDMLRQQCSLGVIQRLTGGGQSGFGFKMAVSVLNSFANGEGGAVPGGNNAPPAIIQLGCPELERVARFQPTRLIVQRVFDRQCQRTFVGGHDVAVTIIDGRCFQVQVAVARKGAVLVIQPPGGEGQGIHGAGRAWLVGLLFWAEQNALRAVKQLHR